MNQPGLRKVTDRPICTSDCSINVRWVNRFSFFFSSRRRHTRFDCDWSSDVCSSDLILGTLSLGRKTVEPFDKPELALLQAAADQIGLALDNARLYSESLRQLDELKRAHAQLIHAEKMKAVGELASGVAHEINNPLTTILGQTHLLLTHPETTSHVRDRLGIVAEEAGRAARIVQNLLLFARHYTPERRPCSVADQARRVLELKGYQLQQDNVRVVTDFASCPFVWADENQLQVVLLNLV